jgi:hypothetical protein
VGKNKAKGFWWENLMEREQLEVPDIYGRIIFK